MKRLPVLMICALLAGLPLSGAQESGKAKAGWNFGVLPALSYNSDLGLQYGICADIYDYGDVFPGYRHKLYTELSHYTQGLTNLHLLYDSSYLIPEVRTTAAVSWLMNPMYSFYGLNGSAQVYDPSLNLNRQTGTAYYNYSRSMLRCLLDAQGEIYSGLRWAAGAAFWSFALGNPSNIHYDPSNTLYADYCAAGLIRGDEASGGKRAEFKIGLVFDTRDHDAAPSRGINADIFLNASPDLFGDGYKYLQFCAHYRQYLDLIPARSGRMVLAWHLAYQDCLEGEAPFYMLPIITTPYLRQIISEGLGSMNTVRGNLYNRFIGDGYAWGNLELRIRLTDFTFLNQGWYIGFNPFFDMGLITRPHRPGAMAAWLGTSMEEVVSAARRLHKSAGAGLKIVMNENFIVSWELAKAFDHDNPGWGLSIGSNYIF